MRYQDWAVPFVFAVVGLAVVLAREPVKRTRASAESAPPPPPPPATIEQPEPLPPEPPFGPLKRADSGLPCDVDEVLAKKCRRCHANPPRHGAPVVFYTWEEMQAPRHERPLYEILGRVVDSGYMPFATPANPPVERLTDAEKRILHDWVAAGAPRGSCDAEKEPDAGKPSSARPKKPKAKRSPVVSAHPAPSASSP